jgi:hypothetical protein
LSGSTSGLTVRHHIILPEAKTNADTDLPGWRTQEDRMNLKKQKEKDRRRARKLADEAWQAAADDNLDLAEKIIRRAVAVQIDNPVLWHDQGVLLLRRGKEDEAERSFRSALRLAPTYAEALDALAALTARRGWSELAVELQAQAVTHAPQNAAFAERLQAYRALAAADEASRLPVEPPGAAPSPPLPCTELPVAEWVSRLAALDWPRIGERLTREGCTLLPGLMEEAVCRALRRLFDRDELFARTVEMDRPDFGRGSYRYFRAPVPELVEGLRAATYPHVAEVANRWQELLGKEERYPATWAAFRERCGQAGQTKPTPILLRYGPGGFNALHRDLRGELFFPVQMAVVLSPRADQAAEGDSGFVGGEFRFCDVPERPKSRCRTLAAGLGDALLFCTRDRLVPIGGVYGLQPVKHGVAEITCGTRDVLGLPFHEYR